MAENRQLKYSLLLTLTAFIWGIAFVAQSAGSAYVGSCTFTGLRFLIGAAALWPVIAKIGTKYQSGAQRRLLWRAGAICGTLLAVASLLQQEGMALGASAGKAGFITAFYIVLVPILNLLIFKQKTGTALWFGVAIAIVGLYLLCINESLVMQQSDLLLLICAFAFSFQILSVDKFSPRFDSLQLAAIEFFVAGLVSSVFMVFREMIPMGLGAWAATLSTWSAWIPLLYTAIFSSSVAYTLQIVCQKELNPALASLLMSLESVFAVLGGWVILGQRMTPRELLGSLLVFIAVLLAQLAPGKKA